jgi:hypothetical protein
MTCPNCGNEHGGEFCNACGQKNGDLHVPIGSLIGEVTEEAFGFDSRVRHTLVPFFLKPGEVTRDYLAGRRARYTSPLKMYLVAAAIYFFAFSQHPRSGYVRIDPKDRAGLADAPGKDGRFTHYMKQRVRKLDDLGQEEATKQIAANMASMLPKALIVLLPIFALLLKLFWRKRYYAEHMIFALHYHAFALLALTPGAAVEGDVATGIALLLCFVYLFVALRRVYGGGRAMTFAKLAGLSSLYTFALAFALAGAGLLSLAFL